MTSTDRGIQDTLAQQRLLYGRTLGERFADVREAYGISQRGLAAALGLSAPMLSQLANGQRIKIGSPVVFARLVTLEERSGEADLDRVLTEVRDSEPVLTTQQVHTAASRTDDLEAGLAGLAGGPALRAAADAARVAGSDVLADVLAMAARRAGDAR
ncbi:helix-turn-helix transcriptional regulator [Micrococcus luteus]|uniref:helix-turn-helix domain-containing protein n=1 Tax=Micrococcus luteus TaxID=1270 RepID=UPI0019107B8F|nr:helix-turn-helix transcriptional regulator [Micrococcus luteus]QQE49366.1 helix-turn-helix transcriptional regulator [Micrococcus luteus]